MSDLREFLEYWAWFDVDRELQNEPSRFGEGDLRALVGWC